jgi:hypothetical protein
MLMYHIVENYEYLLGACIRLYIYIYVCVCVCVCVRARVCFF